VLRQANFEVVGEARDGAKAIDLARLRPDIVILDLKMPNVSGEVAAPEIRRQCPTTRVLILSGAELDEGVLDVLEAGVDGYLPKDVSPDDLTRAIRIIAEGKSYIHADITRLLVRRMVAASAPVTANARDIKLSPREMDVLRLLPTPVTYREIGVKLFISEETVRSHVKNILVKLGQPNRTQAVVTAVKLGLITLE
jgi:DNA-binding NarL/FixJ family response regulator